MRSNRLFAPAVALALALALSVSPALAQGKNKAKDRKRDRAEAAQTSDRRSGEYDWSRQSRGNGAGKVPPGWCRGRGNPHNTPENCGRYAGERYDDRYDDDRDDRYEDDRDDRYGDRYPDSRDGAYRREHEDFHRHLDRKYSDLAARRPLDIQYQLRLRADKAAEHERWHDRAGIRH